MARVATPEETTALREAAKAYMSTVLVMARRFYSDWDSWTADAQHAMTINLGLQGVFVPEAFGVNMIDLNVAFYGAGMACGGQTESVPDINILGLVQHVVNGFSDGRRECLSARAEFKTTGTKQ